MDYLEDWSIWTIWCIWSIRTQGLRNNHDPFDCENMSVRMCLCVRRAFSWPHVFFSHAFSAGVCWRARRVAGLRTARCAASCAHRCAASCAARSAGHHDAAGSLFTKKGRKKNWSGAKDCKSCSPRKMLKNAYLDAKIGFDAEENEPSKVW